MAVEGFAYRWRAALLLIVFLLLTCTMLAEEGVLVLVVMDTEQHPFANVRIGTAGDGGSPQFTDQNGKARLRLAPGTKPDAWVTLLLMGAPNGLDLAFISPYDGRIRVPPFDNEQDNYDPVVLAKHADKSILESGSGMLAIHASINHSVAAQRKKPASQPRRTSRNRWHYSSPLDYGRPRLLTVAVQTATPPAEAPDRSPANAELQKAALAATAQKYGLSVADIKSALADWGGDPLVWKLILLTATIETGGTDPFPAIFATSNDMYFGVGSWSLGNCSLQPLLLRFQKRDEKRFAEIFGADTQWLTKTVSKPCQVSSPAILKRVLDDSGHLQPTWRDRFRRLGHEHSFQRVQVRQMMAWIGPAQNAASTFGLQSEQGLAFCYDEVESHGSNAIMRQRQNLSMDVAAFQQQIGRPPDEQEKLLMLANRMIQRNQEGGRNPMFTATSVARDTLLSQGHGTVFGSSYNLEDFGIGFQDAQTGVDLPLNNDPAILQQLRDGWIPSEGPPPAERFDLDGEKQLVELINRARTTQGLQPLAVDSRLTQAARQHTELLVEHRTLSHQFEGEPALDVRLANENLPSDQEGENTALDDNVASAHKGLMDSPEHRDEILNPDYNVVGVAVIRSGGHVYVTEDFAHVPK
jgi:uncharacterized protein YkwD